MLDAPSATAVAVGIAISSTSLDRTRQFLSRRRDLPAGCRDSPAGRRSAGWSSAAEPATSGTGRSAGGPKTASEPALDGPAVPGSTLRDVLLRVGTVGVPLHLVARRHPRCPGVPNAHRAGSLHAADR